MHQRQRGGRAPIRQDLAEGKIAAEPSRYGADQGAVKKAPNGVVETMIPDAHKIDVMREAGHHRIARRRRRDFHDGNAQR